MRINIDRHAVELHARDRGSYRIHNFLALLVDVVEEFILLGVPQQATEHGVERGILKLFGRKNVSGPIGSAELLRQSDFIIDSDGFGERWAPTVRQPDRGHDVVDAAGRLDPGFVDQPLDFEDRVEDGERQREQWRDIRPGNGPHIEDIDTLAAGPGLDQSDLGAIGIKRSTGRAIARLSDGEISVLVELDWNRLSKFRQYFGLEVQHR